VSQSILVPDAILVENEDLLGLHVSEDEIWVKHIDIEQKFAYMRG
jgi:hypothetical protein